MPKGKRNRSAKWGRLPACRGNSISGRLEACPTRGVTLVEILFVIAILGIVATVAIPLFQPSLASQLQNAADVLVADAARARNLAVANNSKYKIVFSDNGDGYYLRHSGSAASLDALPSWPYRQSTDPADRQTTLLAEMPGLGDVQVIGAVQMTSSDRQRITEIEFDSLGGMTNAQTAEIWLAAGSGTDRRYLPVALHPVTGLARVGDVTGIAPTVDQGNDVNVNLNVNLNEGS